MTAPISDDHEAILQTERRRCDAAIAGNMAVLDELFAEDLLHVHSNAMVHNKQELLHHIESRRPYRRIERGELTTRQYGEIAVLSGPLTNHMELPDGTRPILQGFVTQVLRHDRGF